MYAALQYSGVWTRGGDRVVRQQVGLRKKIGEKVPAYLGLKGG